MSFRIIWNRLLIPLTLLWIGLITYWVWGCWHHGIAGIDYQWWHQNQSWVAGTGIAGAILTILVDLFTRK